MGLRASLLAVLMLHLCLLPGFCGEQEVSCLVCHPVHYAGRGSCVDCHRGNPATRRKEVAHHRLIGGRFAWSAISGSKVSEHGKRTLEGAACRRCHTTGGKGNRLAGDLDRLAGIRAPETLRESIASPALYMPDFRFSRPQAVELVNALLALSRNGTVDDKEVPLLIHFEQQGEGNRFARYCGSCHRALSSNAGGLGEGRVAPNLSGLLTGFYPATFGEGERWTAERLEKWVKNPRSVRKAARMAPVRFDAAGDFSRLLPDLGAGDSPPGH